MDETDIFDKPLDSNLENIVFNYDDNHNIAPASDSMSSSVATLKEFSIDNNQPARAPVKRKLTLSTPIIDTETQLTAAALRDSREYYLHAMEEQIFESKTKKLKRFVRAKADSFFVLGGDLTGSLGEDIGSALSSYLPRAKTTKLQGSRNTRPLTDQSELERALGFADDQDFGINTDYADVPANSDVSTSFTLAE